MPYLRNNGGLEEVEWSQQVRGLQRPYVYHVPHQETNFISLSRVELVSWSYCRMLCHVTEETLAMQS